MHWAGTQGPLRESRARRKELDCKSKQFPAHTWEHTYTPLNNAARLHLFPCHQNDPSTAEKGDRQPSSALAQAKKRCFNQNVHQDNNCCSWRRAEDGRTQAANVKHSDSLESKLGPHLEGKRCWRAVTVSKSSSFNALTEGFSGQRMCVSVCLTKPRPVLLQQAFRLLLNGQSTSEDPVSLAVTWIFGVSERGVQTQAFKGHFSDPQATWHFARDTGKKEVPHSKRATGPHERPGKPAFLPIIKVVNLRLDGHMLPVARMTN